MLIKTTTVVFFVNCLTLNALNVSDGAMAAEQNSLFGREHLKVIVLPFSAKMTRDNETGLVDVKGAVKNAIDWLAEKYNFSYSIAPIYEPSLESSGNFKGAGSYLLSDECDLVLGVILLTYNRYRILDLTHPWTQTSTRFLIFSPDVEPLVLDMHSLSSMFGSMVWVLFLASILGVIGTFHLLNFFNERVAQNRGVPFSSEDSFNYTFGVVLQQGGYCRSRKISVRMLAGSWSLSAWIAVYTFIPLMATIVISPKPPAPLVQSVHDVIEKEQIGLLVNKGLGVDAAISSGEGYMFKKLREKLNLYPNSRCLKTDDCVARTKTGPFAYAYDYSFLLDAMYADYIRTNQCQLALANEPFMGFHASWALSKKSKFTRTINMGILQLREVGLMSFWKDTEHAKPQRCFDRAKEDNTAAQYSRMSWFQFRPVFLLLLIGYSSALLCMAGERLL